MRERKYTAEFIISIINEHLETGKGSKVHFRAGIKLLSEELIALLDERIRDFLYISSGKIMGKKPLERI